MQGSLFETSPKIQQNSWQWNLNIGLPRFVWTFSPNFNSLNFRRRGLEANSKWWSSSWEPPQVHTCTPGHGRNKNTGVIFDWPNICKIMPQKKTVFAFFFVDGIGMVRCCLTDFVLRLISLMMLRALTTFGGCQHAVAVASAMQVLKQALGIRQIYIHTIYHNLPYWHFIRSGLLPLSGHSEVVGNCSVSHCWHFRFGRLGWEDHKKYHTLCIDALRPSIWIWNLCKNSL